MFDRGVVHIVVAGYIVDHYCLRFGREVVCSVVAAYIDYHCFRGVIAVFHIAVVGYIVDHYYLRFDSEWFILLWLVILSTITV